MRLGTPLDSGDAFPDLVFDTVAHGRIALPEHVRGRYSVVLAYRGHW